MIRICGFLLYITFLFTQEIISDSLLYSDKPLKDPMKAMLFSSVLPGAGQYYNESYIKTTIVSLGFTYFLVEAVKYNSKINDLKSSNLVNSNFGLYKQKIDSYYDDRNVAIWRLLGIYTYNILDAYIGAYLFGFDDIMDDKEKGTTSSFNLDYNKNVYQFNISLKF